VLAPNGHIYFIPYNADSIGAFDPFTRAFSALDISGVISHDVKFCGGVLASNGHIYMVPDNANSVGDFDPATGAFSTISISGVISQEHKYTGGVLALTGHMYMVPYRAGSIGKLHLSRQEPTYEVAGCVPVTWGTLLSPHLNKY